MAVASYLQCKSSPSVSRGFAIGAVQVLEDDAYPSINRTVKKLRFLTAGYVKRWAGQFHRTRLEQSG